VQKLKAKKKALRCRFLTTMLSTDPKYYEGDAAIDCHARYLTDRESAPQEKHMQFAAGVDPSGVIERLRGTRYIHTEDNQVEYCQITTEEEGSVLLPSTSVSLANLSSRYEPVLPSVFKEGDVVEAMVSFHCIPVKDGYKFITSLRALVLVSSDVRMVRT
jgi:hypothetical protein